MKIKEIQTIVTEDPNNFDCAVNGLLAEGYALVRRGIEQVGPTAWKLYGELVKVEEADVETREITWQEAVEVLRETCRQAVDCDSSCPMYRWCKDNIMEPAPAHWRD